MRYCQPRACKERTQPSGDVREQRIRHDVEASPEGRWRITVRIELVEDPDAATGSATRAGSRRVLTGSGTTATTWKSKRDDIAERAGWMEGGIRTKAFSHTYCAARLQTLDTRAPVSVYTVAKEARPRGRSMVRRVYGHLGAIRHRSEHVEFWVENHINSVKSYAERVRKLAQ
ncbi:MAG: hypothetical protein GEU90_16810 [Gemmatimonas sp.]|nr:hypothetical protein [Gemmatimonas sp.]